VCTFDGCYRITGDLDTEAKILPRLFKPGRCLKGRIQWETRLSATFHFHERRFTDFSSRRRKLGQFMPLMPLLEDFACAAGEGFYERPIYGEIGQDLVVST
jgi:hypothetical protein